MNDVAALVSGFTQLAQGLATATDMQTRLDITVAAAVSLVDRCDHAGITISLEGTLVTRASGDETACLADRWQGWVERVHEELAVESMMSLLIDTDDDSFGALTLYCGRGCRFDADDVAVAQAVAGHLSVSMAAERQVNQLSLALHNRSLTGQAQGVLMERFEMTADQAFDYLRRVSSVTNRKVALVAADIAATRHVPGLGETHSPRPRR